MHLRISKPRYNKNATIEPLKKKLLMSNLKKKAPKKKIKRLYGHPMKYNTQDSICLRHKKRISYSDTCISTKYKKRRGKKSVTKEIKTSKKLKKLARSLKSSRMIVKEKNEIKQLNSLDKIVNCNDTIMHIENDDDSVVFLSEKTNNNASLDIHQHVKDNLPLLNLRCVNKKTGETQFGIPLHKRFIRYIEPLIRKSPSQVSIITIASDKSEDKLQQQETNSDEDAYLKEFVKMLEITNGDGNFGDGNFGDGNFIDAFDNQNALPIDDNYFWI